MLITQQYYFYYYNGNNNYSPTTHLKGVSKYTIYFFYMLEEKKLKTKSDRETKVTCVNLTLTPGDRKMTRYFGKVSITFANELIFPPIAE